MSLAMASSLASQGRSQVVSRAKKTPSPSVCVPKTPSKTLSDSKKRLNSSDGSSKRHTDPKSPFRVERSSTGRPSDRLNPKTVDPVSMINLFSSQQTTITKNILQCTIWDCKKTFLDVL